MDLKRHKLSAAHLVSALFFVLAIASFWLIPSAENVIYDSARDACTDFDSNLRRLEISNQPSRELHSSIGLIATIDIGRLSKAERAALQGGSWDSSQELEVYRRISSKKPAVLIIDKPDSTLDKVALESESWPCPIWMPISSKSSIVAPTQANLNENGLHYLPWSYRYAEDKRVRKVDLAIKNSGKWQATLPLALYCHFLGIPQSEVIFGQNFVQIPGKKSVAVSNLGDALSYEYNGYRAWEDTSDSFNLDLLAPTPIQSLLGSYGAAFDHLVPNRYIFAGDYTQTASYERLTPFGKYRDFQLLAVSFDSLIKQYSLGRLSGFPFVLAFIVWNGLAYKAIKYASSSTKLVLTVFSLATIRMVSTLLLLWLNITYWPVLADFILIAGYALGSATGMWSRSLGMLSYFGGSAARSAGALAGRAAFFDEIDDREATILFINLPEHLKILERINSVELFNRRKEFSAMVTTVSNGYGGIIHDYQADALMIGFGTNVQFRDPEHALHAVQAAKALHLAFQELHSNWIEATESEYLKMYAGLCTGEVAVGFVGARKYKQAPAAIGDTTNVAARLMGSAKKQSVDIIASKLTRERCADEIEVEELAPVQLKGKTSLVEIFRVINVKEVAN